jgi:putative spermidine/putrescine transport system ATP-binding protein
MTDVLVRFKDVQKSYDGETLVVKDLNLDVLRGEFLTLLGPSGSGKTTCLLMLAGFETTTRGEIILEGKTINHVPPYKRGIGFVFQNYALFPHMTVADNVAFPLLVRGVARPDIAARVGRALDMVQLGGFGGRRPAQLSGGQQQRVAVARALVFEPTLVLMDEPLGALDRQLREQMQYEIKRIHAELGVTVIYVTHDQSEALTMSDRIAVFHDGVVQQLATPARLYEEPENAFVARFIGENNRLRGRVSRLAGATCTVELAGGDRIEALAVNIGPVGSETTVSLRPERVQIQPERGSCANVFDARVEELTYLGDHVRVRLGVCGRDDFIVKVPNAHRRVELQPGKAVQIGWHVDDGRALDVPA